MIAVAPETTIKARGDLTPPAPWGVVQGHYVLAEWDCKNIDPKLNGKPVSSDEVFFYSYHRLKREGNPAAEEMWKAKYGNTRAPLDL